MLDFSTYSRGLLTAQDSLVVEEKNFQILQQKRKELSKGGFGRIGFLYWTKNGLKTRVNYLWQKGVHLASFLSASALWIFFTVSHFYLNHGKGHA